MVAITCGNRSQTADLSARERKDAYMSGHQLRLSSVYSLLILIPLLAACQSDNERDVAYSDIEPADNVLQAGSANQLNDDQAVQMSGNGPMDAVADEYGRATEQFTMVDGSDVIVVHSYPGFMVGYNEQKQIHFIDVYSAEINPGLGGITIGSSLDDALEKLGEPDQLTSSVLMYERDGSVLKLDIDQTTGTIVSIKLFASDE